MLAPLILAATLSAWPTPLKDAMKAEPPPAPMAFTLNVRTAQEALTVNHNAGRWSLQQPSGRALTKSEQTLFKNMQDYKPERDFTCAGRAEIVPDSVTVKAETPDAIVYGYKPKAGPNTPKDLAPALKHAEGEIMVSKVTGRLIGGRIYTVRQFSPAPFAAVKSYIDNYECAPGPDGASLVTRSSIRATFEALGKTYNIKRDIALSDARPAS
jgi:hypothetical protein